MRAEDLTAWWPCPQEDAANALASLARCPWLTDWWYALDEQRAFWTLSPSELDGAQAAHLRVKQHVQRSISEHAAVGWE